MVFLWIISLGLVLAVAGVACRRLARTGSVLGASEKYADLTADTFVRDRVCVVTGANSGIGAETAVGLLLAGAQRVYLACRTQKKAEGAIVYIAKQCVRRSGRTIAWHERLSFIRLDLSDGESIDECARTLASREPVGIHLLVNNAGVVTENDGTTKDGHAEVVGVNHLGTMRCTLSFLPLLAKAAQGPGAPPSRIVVVGSRAADLFPVLSLDEDLTAATRTGSAFAAFQAYCTSKLYNALFAFHLAAELKKKNAPITVNVVHPGWVHTNLASNVGNMQRVAAFSASLLAKDAWLGAQTSLHVACAPSLENVSGSFFENCQQAELRNRKAYDTGVQDKLWRKSCDLLRYEDDPVVF